VIASWAGVVSRRRRLDRWQPAASARRRLAIARAGPGGG
jgi:hypothetical protein